MKKYITWEIARPKSMQAMAGHFIRTRPPSLSLSHSLARSLARFHIHSSITFYTFVVVIVVLALSFHWLGRVRAFALSRSIRPAVRGASRKIHRHGWQDIFIVMKNFLYCIKLCMNMNMNIIHREHTH